MTMECVDMRGSHGRRSSEQDVLLSNLFETAFAFKELAFFHHSKKGSFTMLLIYFSLLHLDHFYKNLLNVTYQICTTSSFHILYDILLLVYKEWAD